MTVDWERFRKCTVCGALMGKPCMSQTGALIGGRYMAAAITLLCDQPHSTRKPRRGREAG